MTKPVDSFKFEDSLECYFGDDNIFFCKGAFMHSFSLKSEEKKELSACLKVLKEEFTIAGIRFLIVTHHEETEFFISYGNFVTLITTDDLTLVKFGRFIHEQTEKQLAEET